LSPTNASKKSFAVPYSSRTNGSFSSNASSSPISVLVTTFDPSAPTSVMSPIVIANPTPGMSTGIQLSMAVTIE
jgi:hypothetical protein